MIPFSKAEPTESQIVYASQLEVNHTYDGATMKLYVNGDLVASKDVTGSISNTDNPFQVGHKGLGAKIKSVTVHDRVK